MMLEDLRAAFRERFASVPAACTRAPGRLEVLGNHTDYNEGFVLSCAVDRATWCLLSSTETTTGHLVDLRDESEAHLDLDDLGAARAGEWGNYLKGVILALRARGFEVGGFEGVIRSDLPLSAGMSSSAALEISFALALGKLFGFELSELAWAEVGRSAEADYLGARTGLLDQLSCMRGRAGHLLLTDFRTLESRLLSIPRGLAFVVANSRVRHDLTLEYNERRSSCERAARALGVPFLRDVSGAELERTRAVMDPVAFSRATHVIGENERVLEAVPILQRGDVDRGDAQRLGALLLASHESSRSNFENSCAELDALVEIGKELPGCFGARLSGGGFGGITIHLVEAERAEAYRAQLAAATLDRLGKDVDTMTCAPGDGAKIVEL